MRKLLALAVMLLAAIGLATVAAAAMIAKDGFTARARASWLEMGAARLLRTLATPRSAKDLRSPIEGVPSVITRARRHFATECAGCHGNDGSGDTEIGRNLFPRPPDLRKDPQRLTEGEIFHVITNGIRFSGMPAFGKPGDEGEAREHWEIVYFIRHLPHVTPGELDDMKRYNPRSPVGEDAGGEGHHHHGAASEQPQKSQRQAPKGGKKGAAGHEHIH